MWAVVRWLGVLAGTISLFNLVVSIASVGLSPTFEALTSFYQIIFYPLVSWVNLKHRLGHGDAFGLTRFVA